MICPKPTLPITHRGTLTTARLLTLFLTLLGSAFFSRPGHADETQNALRFNELDRIGSESYEKQDFETAIKNFELAYAIKPEPLILYNIAQCHRKLNHDAEAITYYQSYLNSAGGVDRELRAKAGRYVVELRDKNAATLPPTKVYLETTRQKRPLWRIGLGAGLIGASTVLLGFGGRALALNGACIDTPVGPQQQCNSVLDTQALGVGLVVGGVVMAIGGAVAIAIPGRSYQRERPAEPQGEQRQIKPRAALSPFLPTADGNAGMSASAE